MPPPDPIGDRIAAAFDNPRRPKTRGGYTLTERRGGRPMARIKPLSDTDRFELFCWFFARGRWKTFGDFGRHRLELDDAATIVRADPMFRIKQKGVLHLTCWLKSS